MIYTAGDLVNNRGYREDVAAAVYEHARDIGTLDKIQRGELAWPDRLDAQQWYDNLPVDSVYRPKGKGP